ncbi:MAG: SDR family oxidoreductase [Elusimicrobia bacterium]|nr:SDR family oxidoreductase [Elusimicrobiota bacterium]
MAGLALVTGASSGIGRAISRRLAIAGWDLALNGRDQARLEETARLCEPFAIKTRVIAQDLCRPEGARELWRRLEGAPVAALVNNAGFTLCGPFAKTDGRREEEMVRLHICSMLELTKLALEGMLARGKGHIVIIGSVYSFAAAPGQAVYGATKAFLLNFTQSLAQELSGTGVKVTAVCPGSTETELRSRAGVAARGPRGMSPEAVAEAAFRGMTAGQRLIVPGALNRVLVAFARHLPRTWVPFLVQRINRARGLGA